MKAILGKLSILCFVALIIILLCAIPIIAADDPMGAVFLLVFLTPLFTTVGLVLGYLSALKQETPKCYRYIGFFLNLAWFPCVVLYVLCRTPF